MEITRLSGFEQRNPLLLREAEGLLKQDLGDLVGKSDRENGAKFYKLGAFHSSALNEQVYGGLKIVADGNDLKEMEQYFLSSLCSLLAMEQFFPEVISQTPLFMGG